MKPAIRVAAATVLLAAGNVHAQADESPPRVIENMGRPVYVAPMFSFTIDDSARRTKVGYGGTLTLGTRLLSFAAIEAQAHYTKFNDDGENFVGARTEATGYGANLLLFPLPGSLRNLFLLGGASYNDVSSHPFTGPGGVVSLADYDSTVYDLGLGYLLNFALFRNPAALRVEARYRLDEHDTAGIGDGNTQNFDDVVINAGVMFPLFYSPPPPPPPPEPEPVQVVAVADSDGDGVLDDVDQCPDTPFGTEVDSSGCPIPEPEPVCVPSGANGDADLSGCVSGDVVVLRGVNFEFDSERLTADADSILDQVAAALDAAPDIRVEVGGHTDGRGSADYNQRLSERRAASVRDGLVARGVAEDRLSAVGYGLAQPIADNDTEEGREQNRRVELTVQ